MSDDEPPYDEAEIEEARQLAELIEHPSPPARGLEDALDAAHVVSVLRAPTLSAAREDKVLNRTLATIAQRRRKTRLQIFAISGAGVAALAAVALLTFVRPSAPSPQAASAPTSAAAPQAGAARAGAATETADVPPPSSAALRAAQRAWLDAPSPAQRRALQQALEQHREALLASVERRYAR